MYKLSLTILGEEYKSTGETIDEAFVNLGIDYMAIKAKGIVKIKKGKSSYEHLFNIQTLRRIISNKIVRAFWDKNLNLLLDSPKETNVPK